MSNYSNDKLRPEQEFSNNINNFNDSSSSNTDDLICPKCLKDFNLDNNIPLTLSCGHIICKSCLINLSNKSKKKICPLANEEYTTYQICQSIAEFIEQERKFVCKNHHNNRIKYYCEYDNNYFCSKCRANHLGEQHRIHNFIPDKSFFNELNFLNSRISEKKINLNEELKKIQDCRLILLSKNKEHITQIENYITGFIDNLNKFKENFIEKIQSIYSGQLDLIEKGNIVIHDEFMYLEDIQNDINYLEEIKNKSHLIFENVLEKKKQVLQKWEKQLKISSQRDGKLINNLSYPVISFNTSFNFEKILVNSHFEFFEKKEELSPKYSNYDEPIAIARKVNSERKNQSLSSLESNGKKEKVKIKRKGSEPTTDTEKKTIEIQLSNVPQKPIIITDHASRLFLPNTTKRTFEKRGNSFRQQNTMPTNEVNGNGKNFNNKLKKALGSL